ncbi:MAG: hypothetical protein PHS14_17755, partial [Elusimicrobia bacterium]|nr:hypothetical protein [Elusimicrobiota bacterium]
DMPLRAFLNKHAKGLSGTKQFVLILAHCAKGNESHEIELSEIQNNWERAIGVLGTKFNRSCTIRARESDWADNPRKGFFVLRPRWKEVFE